MIPLEGRSIKRKVGEKKDARIIHLLYEGQNTEPLFINSFIKNSTYFDSKKIRFVYFEKTENDCGVTNIKQLIELAKKYKKNNKSFRKSYDKILIVFDLDVFKNNQNEINEILIHIDNDIILAYTNPAIELFLLLTLKNSYEEHINKYKNEILKNDFVNDKRFIYNLFCQLTNIDSKSSNENINTLVERFEIAIAQENLYLNHYLDKAANELTSNIGYVFKKIKNLDFDIIYTSQKK